MRLAMIRAFAVRGLAAIAILAAGIVGITPRPAGAEGRTYLVPDDESETLPILIDGKVRTYYAIDADDPLSLSVPGPTTLTLMVRLVFTQGMPDTAAYGIEVSEGKALLKKHWTTTRRGNDAFVPAGPKVPGLSRKLSVEIPEGAHALTIALLGKDAQAAAARFYIPGNYRADEYASIAPLDPRETVTALAEEKQIAYYLVDADKPLTVRIVGPTKLRVLSRLTFDEGLRGKRRYALRVEEEGRLVREDMLFTTRSTSVVFTDRQEIVPGKDKVTLIDVPKGVHSFTVRLGAGSESPLAAVRFTIPKGDLDKSAANARR